MARETRNVQSPECRARIEKREDGKTFIVGYGAVFYDGKPENEFNMGPTWDGRAYVERVSRNAFDRALKEKDDVRGLQNHEPNMLLGRTSAGSMEIETDEKGLRYIIPVDMEDPDHKRVLRKIERGDLTGSSFSFEVESRTIDEDEKQVIRTITGVKLYDVGPVTFHAYAGTSATAQRDAQGAVADLDGIKAEAEKRQREEMEMTIKIRSAQKNM